MSKLIFTLICLSAFGGAIPCQAKIIYVDDDGPADLNNIQAGIDAAKDEDTVVVADGTYTGDGNRDIDFLGKAIIVRSENGPEKCIIDCEERGRGFDFHNNEDTNSVVDGFTITHGHGNGGGIACHSNSSPTINNCIITGNWATGSGGGISCYSSSTITNCIITGNYACWDAGGGISCGGNTTVSNCTINSNTAHYIGGGIYCGSGNPTIINSTISGNRAGCGGGSACNATDRQHPNIDQLHHQWQLWWRNLLYLQQF
jgi:parallel beta-helix repeat protein